MVEIDPQRLDLAREFRARPFGVHSPDLQSVLNRMRGGAAQGKYCLLMSKPHAEWLLARMTGEPLQPQVVPGYVFFSLEEAEFIFEKGCDTLIVGAGQYGNVQLSPEAADFFARHRCRVILQPTPEAVETYNRKKPKAIGLFHVTC